MKPVCPSNDGRFMTPANLLSSNLVRNNAADWSLCTTTNCSTFEPSPAYNLFSPLTIYMLIASLVSISKDGAPDATLDLGGTMNHSHYRELRRAPHNLEAPQT